MKKIINFFKQYSGESTYIALAVCLYLLGINTQIGWFFLLTAFILAVVLISLYSGKKQLTRLSVERMMPQAAFEGEEIAINLILYNQDKRRKNLILIEDLLAQEVFEQSSHLMAEEIAPLGKLHLSYRGRPLLRGVYRGLKIRLTTAYPFGLFEKSREFSPPGELVVYPSAPRISLPAALGQNFAWVSISGKKNYPGKSGDFLSIREYQPMEDTKFIHWKTSARQGRLMIKEFTIPSSSPLLVILHNYQKISAGEKKLHSLEYGIRTAASIAESILARNSSIDFLSLEGGKTNFQSFTNRISALEFLARMENDGKIPLLEILQKNISLLSREKLLVIISPEPVDPQALKTILRKRKAYVLLINAADFARGVNQQLPTKETYLKCADNLRKLGIRSEIIDPGSDIKESLHNLLSNNHYERNFQQMEK